MARKALSAWPAMFLIYVAAVGGCDPEYNSRTKFPAAAISERVTWKASGGVRAPQSAIDDDLSTAAITSYSYANRVIIIDLGKVCVFNTVIIEHGSDEFGFCRRVGISTSIDGKEYTQQIAGPGTRRVSIFAVIRPVLGRYVRLQAIVPGNRPWSIAEVHLR